ncbi:MAG TPA: replicative DNA helicase [bacterium]|nr:replicative DNA helicase [bacterium]
MGAEVIHIQGGVSVAPSAPFDLEAERAVLGAILVEVEAISRAADVVRDVDFYLEKHRRIYGRMLAMWEAARPVDIVTLAADFRQEGVLEQIGGIVYLSSLLDAAPLTAHVAEYARIVRERSEARQAMEAGRNAEERIQSGDPVREVVAALQSRLFGIQEGADGGAAVPIGSLMQGAYGVIERQSESVGGVTGIPTGLAGLDKMLSGLQKSDLLILAARPSMGKTALALNIAVHAALREGVPSLFFSMEMSKEQLALRVLLSEARVDGRKAQGPGLSEADWERLALAADRLRDGKLFIDDTPGPNVLDLRARCQRVRREYGLGLVVADYLQLMTGVGKVGSREQEISQISRSLKALAKDMNIPIIALSQLNRSLESRTDKRPLISDLRESGAIEQDADIVMFIYREAVYKRQDGSEDHLSEAARRHAEVIVAKQRNGPIGTVDLVFIGEHFRFETMATWG